MLRKMRYHDRIRGIPVAGDEDYTENARAREDAATLARRTEAADRRGAPADASGDLGLSPEDWAATGAAMAEEATQAQDGTATNGDGEPEIIEPPGPSFADAFSPAEPEPENDEPEISGRDEKYREQLRETEADRDQLRGLLESARRSEIERQASGRLADPGDLWYRDNTSVADLLNESGDVDPTKVDAAVTDLLEAHAHWASPRAVFRGELRSGATSNVIDPPAKSFVDAFAPPKSE